jgi:hypothetical protein
MSDEVDQILYDSPGPWLQPTQLLLDGTSCVSKAQPAQGSSGDHGPEYAAAPHLWHPSASSHRLQASTQTWHPWPTCSTSADHRNVNVKHEIPEQLD